MRTKIQKELERIYPNISKEHVNEMVNIFLFHSSENAKTMKKIKEKKEQC